MTRVLAALVLALLATAAQADEWTFEDLDVPIAYVDNGAAQLQFACRGGDLALGFWVRAPHRTVAGARAMNLAITPDPAAGSEGKAPAGSSFAQDIPVIHSDGSSMIIRGPVAGQWARIAQKAKSAIQVAYVRPAAQGGLEVFDSNRFGAGGSSAAIKRVLERCG